MPDSNFPILFGTCFIVFILHFYFEYENMKYLKKLLCFLSFFSHSIGFTVSNNPAKDWNLEPFLHFNCVHTLYAWNKTHLYSYRKTLNTEQYRAHCVSQGEKKKKFLADGLKTIHVYPQLVCKLSWVQVASSTHCILLYTPACLSTCLPFPSNWPRFAK